MWRRPITATMLVALLLVPGEGALAAPSDGFVDDVPYAPPDPFHPVPPRDPPAAPGERLPLGWAPPSDVVVRYQRPSAGRVLRLFEPSSTAYGPGHRGVDLAHAPGAPVTAAAAGFVHHAGPVGDTVWVSIGHADGILTSYGPLADVEVRRGDQVDRGQRLGSLAPGGHGHGGQDEGLHWGARRGITYLDPLTLLDPGTPRPSLIGDGAWRGIDHAVVPYEPWGGARWGGARLARSPEAQAPGFAVPPSANHLVMVAGLGSDSSEVVLDPNHLGYPDRSVTYLSYAGRVDPEQVDPDDPRRDQLPYDHTDTWPGVEEAAKRLEEQLRAQKQREPGRGVDLIGHSQGGQVILHYITHLHDPYDPGLPTIARVVTIGTAHQGSDLATAAWLARASPVAGAFVELGRGIVANGDRIDLDAPAIDQVATGSPYLSRYRRAWNDALDAGFAGPLAMGTEVLTISGATDVVVRNDSAHLPGDDDLMMYTTGAGRQGFAAADVLQSTVLPGGHNSVLDTEAVREVTWRFLAGEGFTTAEAPAISALTDDVGLAATVAVAYTFVAGGVVGRAGQGLHRFVAPTDALEDLPEPLTEEPW
jgi:hypothetical protein